MAEIQLALAGCAPARPCRYDDAIIRASAEKIASLCVEWDQTSKPEDWVDDLIRCRYDWDDGYRLARALEDRCHVQADAELVDALYSASSIWSFMLSEAVQQWVKSVGFIPQHAVGDVVKCRHGTGPIRHVNLDTAEYVVATTDREWSGDGSGYVIAAEAVESAA